ncbi:MAG: fasciclin domain-containing protein [Alphaproteobacteria bacterium]|nr:fasciclin domain-containing protein [Alphaproteobacteria bacterium]
MTRILHWALAPLAVLALAGCGGGDDKAAPDGAPAPSARTLAASLDGAGDLSTLDRVVDNAGLSTVLEGKGPYTVLAPADAAFAADAAGTHFTDQTQRAAAAALLRAHILPGALTRADIRDAISRSGAGGARMRTMADGLVTFTMDGETIVATSADGAQARLTGGETAASNGVVQPVDALLVKAATPVV